MIPQHNFILVQAEFYAPLKAIENDTFLIIMVDVLIKVFYHIKRHFDHDTCACLYMIRPCFGTLFFQVTMKQLGRHEVSIIMPDVTSGFFFGVTSL